MALACIVSPLGRIERELLRLKRDERLRTGGTGGWHACG